MLVYGDPSYQEELSALTARLRANVAQAACTPPPTTLDTLRALLIEAGQWEQAVWDSLGQWPAGATLQIGLLCQSVTDHLARAFCACWGEAGNEAAPPERLHTRLRDALGTLDGLPRLPPVRAGVKLPEGYAFYALYPEQYALAAWRWAAQRSGEQARRVLVVGVRSIGTSLSAVVAATLNALGWQAQRITVRPEGPPFERHAVLPAQAHVGADWALAVDEGPGQSGSSLASVAQALAEQGMEPSRVCFFPGHGGEPGAAASEAVRAWHTRAPRCTASRDDLRWNGQSLTQLLAACTQALGGSDAPVVRVEDWGGGLWRRFVYADAAQWPACCTPFERPKFRCVRADESSVLWSYAGLAAGPDGPQTDAACARLQARAEAGWTPAPLATALGFVASLWVDGTPLTASEAEDVEVMACLGRCIAGAAGPPLDTQAQVQAVQRLGEMLYWNTWEALGEEAAARTRLGRAVAEAWASGHAAPTSGDGRMAPHKWLRTPEGALLKTDGGGHDADHTLRGRQPLAWDIAGAWVEWEMDGTAAQSLLDACAGAGGAPGPPDVLAFYQAAYAAFRLGQCALCADMLAHDPQEQARLRAAGARYRAQLARLLG